MTDTNPYTVSIFLLTYNQEQFIAQTIESIVRQKTDFNYQLVIGEDSSPDTTRAICEKYAKEYAEKIKLLPDAGSNLGLIANYVRTIKECEGIYIAICDGDDYWTDSLKLQKQVDFLKANPKCDIVYTNYTKLYPDGTVQPNAIHRKEPLSGFTDLLENNFIPSVTALFRNRQQENDIPAWITKYPYGDWPTYLWTIRNGGKIGYIDHDTAMYRMDIGTSANIVKTNSKLLKINLGILSDMHNDPVFLDKKEMIGETLNHRNLELMTSYHREGSWFLGLGQFFRNLITYKNRLHTIRLYAYSIKKKINS